MSRMRRALCGANLRRVVQVACFLLFAWLFVAARLRAGTELNPALGLFFWIDPLLLVATWLSGHAVPAIALLALVTVVVTVLFGRVFCGWVCPLGTLHAGAGAVCDRVWPNRKRRDHWSPRQRTKYYLLAGLLAMALIGGHWATLFDPIVFLYRSLTVAVLPGFQWAVDEGTTAIYQADPGVGSWRLASATEPARGFLRRHVFAVENQTFLGAAVILTLFVATLLANAWRRRFWCRYLCPLGAMLGVLAWRPLVRRKVAAEGCNQCDLCASACHGAAASAPGSQWKPSECFSCFNCSESCRRQSLSFSLTVPWRREPAIESVDLSKRMLAASMLGGLAGLWLLRSGPQSSASRLGYQARGLWFHPDLIRPPGSRGERDFLQRCTACGLCMKVCPTGGLQPALFEAGLEGLWTPRLVPRLGYCDFDCNLCTQVCPTEAIQPLSIPEKQETRLGLAGFDTSRCIPYAYGRDCMVCEEHCPIPDKAIYSLDVEIRDRNGEMKTIKRPYVDPDLCIGCGVCESVCPLKDRPGIRVASANESRNPANQPILPEDDLY
ncbi:MAG: 4Fe-4S binding protein [Rhodopirellula sp.]|nr:4Fe-4S binding protein [Rhodopirellula sp.]